MSPLLVIGVLASAAWAAAGLALLRAEARAYGRRTLHAAPAGIPPPACATPSREP